MSFYILFNIYLIDAAKLQSNIQLTNYLIKKVINQICFNFQ